MLCLIAKEYSMSTKENNHKPKKTYEHFIIDSKFCYLNTRILNYLELIYNL